MLAEDPLDDETLGPGLEVLTAVGEDLVTKGEPSLKKQENFTYTTDLQIIHQSFKLIILAPNYTSWLQIRHHDSKLYIIASN